MLYKRMLDGTVDEYSATQKIHKSDVTAHCLYLVKNLESTQVEPGVKADKLAGQQGGWQMNFRSSANFQSSTAEEKLPQVFI